MTDLNFDVDQDFDTAKQSYDCTLDSFSSLVYREGEIRLQSLSEESLDRILEEGQQSSEKNQDKIQEAIVQCSPASVEQYKDQIDERKIVELMEIVDSGIENAAEEFFDLLYTDGSFLTEQEVIYRLVQTNKGRRFLVENLGKFYYDVLKSEIFVLLSAVEYLQAREQGNMLETYAEKEDISREDFEDVLIPAIRARMLPDSNMVFLREKLTRERLFSEGTVVKGIRDEILKQDSQVFEGETSHMVTLLLRCWDQYPEVIMDNLDVIVTNLDIEEVEIIWTEAALRDNIEVKRQTMREARTVMIKAPDSFEMVLERMLYEVLCFDKWVGIERLFNLDTDNVELQKEMSAKRDDFIKKYKRLGRLFRDYEKYPERIPVEEAREAGEAFSQAYADIAARYKEICIEYGPQYLKHVFAAANRSEYREIIDEEVLLAVAKKADYYPDLEYLSSDSYMWQLKERYPKSYKKFEAIFKERLPIAYKKMIVTDPFKFISSFREDMDLREDMLEEWGEDNDSMLKFAYSEAVYKPKDQELFTLLMSHMINPPTEKFPEYQSEIVKELFEGPMKIRTLFALTPAHYEVFGSPAKEQLREICEWQVEFLTMGFESLGVHGQDEIVLGVLEKQEASVDRGVQYKLHTEKEDYIQHYFDFLANPSKPVNFTLATRWYHDYAHLRSDGRNAKQILRTIVKDQEVDSRRLLSNSRYRQYAYPKAPERSYDPVILLEARKEGMKYLEADKAGISPSFYSFDTLLENESLCCFMERSFGEKEATRLKDFFQKAGVKVERNYREMQFTWDGEKLVMGGKVVIDVALETFFKAMEVEADYIVASRSEGCLPFSRVAPDVSEDQRDRLLEVCTRNPGHIFAYSEAIENLTRIKGSYVAQKLPEIKDRFEGSMEVFEGIMDILAEHYPQRIFTEDGMEAVCFLGALKRREVMIKAGKKAMVSAFASYPFDGKVLGPDQIIEEIIEHDPVEAYRTFLCHRVEVAWRKIGLGDEWERIKKKVERKSLDRHIFCYLGHDTNTLGQDETLVFMKDIKDDWVEIKSKSEFEDRLHRFHWKLLLSRFLKMCGPEGIEPSKEGIERGQRYLLRMQEKFGPKPVFKDKNVITLIGKDYHRKAKEIDRAIIGQEPASYKDFVYRRDTLDSGAILHEIQYTPPPLVLFFVGHGASELDMGSIAIDIDDDDNRLDDLAAALIDRWKSGRFEWSEENRDYLFIGGCSTADDIREDLVTRLRKAGVPLPNFSATAEHSQYIYIDTANTKYGDVVLDRTVFAPHPETGDEQITFDSMRVNKEKYFDMGMLPSVPPTYVNRIVREMWGLELDDIFEKSPILLKLKDQLFIESPFKEFKYEFWPETEVELLDILAKNGIDLVSKDACNLVKIFNSLYAEERFMQLF